MHTELTSNAFRESDNVNSEMFTLSLADVTENDCATNEFTLGAHWL